MSDSNVYNFPINDGATPADPPSFDGGEGGPPYTDLARRVSVLEGDSRDIKAALQRLELSSMRVETLLGSLASKEDVAVTTGAVEVLGQRVAAVEDRVKAVETTINGAMASAIGKPIGPWQLPAILAATGSIVLLLVGAVAWLLKQPWFAHA